MQLWKLLFSGKHLCRENSTRPTHQAVIFFARYTNSICSSAVHTANVKLPHISVFPPGKGVQCPGPSRVPRLQGRGRAALALLTPRPPPDPGFAKGTQSSLLSRALGTAPLPPCFMGHGRRNLAVVEIMTFGHRKDSGIEIPVFLSSPLPAYCISI